MDTFHAYGIAGLRDHSQQVGGIADLLLRVADAASSATMQQRDPHQVDPMTVPLHIGLRHPLRLCDVLPFEPEITCSQQWGSMRVMELILEASMPPQTGGGSHHIALPSDIHAFAPQLWSWPSLDHENPVAQRLQQHVDVALTAHTARSSQEVQELFPVSEMPDTTRSLSLLYNVSTTHWLHILLRVDRGRAAGQILVHNSASTLAEPDSIQALKERLDAEIPLLAKLISMRPGLSWQGLQWPATVAYHACPQLTDYSDSLFYAAECARRCWLGVNVDYPVPPLVSGPRYGVFLRLSSLRKLCEIMDSTGATEPVTPSEFDAESATTQNLEDFIKTQAAFDTGYEEGYDEGLRAAGVAHAHAGKENGWHESDQAVLSVDASFVPLPCPFAGCYEAGVDWNDLQAHVEIVHGGRSLHTGLDFGSLPPADNLEALGINTPAPSQRNTFKCRVQKCEKVYKQVEGLQYHLEHAHRNDLLGENRDGSLSIIASLEAGREKEFRCDATGCGKAFSQMDGLIRHRRFEHVQRAAQSPRLLSRLTKCTPVSYGS